MAITLLRVGQAITASFLNKLAVGVNTTALAGIIPTSVEGAGVSVTANGKVVFNGAYSVSVNGVFNGSYDNYRITWNSFSRTGASSTQFHLRAAGTDANVNYDYVKGVDASTSRTVSSSSSSNAVPLDQGVAAGQTSDGVIDLYGPALTQYTAGTVQSAVLASSALTSCQISFAQEQSVSYDGFTLFMLTSPHSFSGSLRVYGYNTLA